MRLLTLLCAILIIANVAAYFWPDTANYAPHIYQAKDETNPHFLRLNKEIEDKFYSQPITSLDQGGLGDQPTADGDCFRLGPFMHRANYELAQAALLNADVNFKKSRRDSKESNVYRVYLGPYLSQAEVADIRVELKRSNVLDHFVRKEEDSRLIISLGIYTTKETAETAVGLFAEKLDEVKLKEELVVLPDSFWLHFVLDESSPVYESLSRMDWGEQSAKMGKFQCLL